MKLGGFALAKDPQRRSRHDRRSARRALHGSRAADQREGRRLCGGASLWELLTGRPPPENVELLSSVRRDLPRELLAAVDAALEPNSQKRTISCADMASWIKKVTHTARGRKEVRERVAEVATANDFSHEPTMATAESSGRIPLVGWTAKPGRAAFFRPGHGGSIG